MPSEYNEFEIRHLEGGAHIRLRPSMYVGPLPNPAVATRLVQESLCLSVDEAVCGRCTEIAVAVDPSGVFTIRDNGPGLSMEPVSDSDSRVLAEIMLTKVGACRAAKQSETLKSVCCHLGMVVVNALSEWLKMRVLRDGGCWFQEYRKGKAQAPFVREADANETGLEISFRPDIGIFGKLEFDALALAEWFPSAGLRFETLDYCPGNASLGEPLVVHFRGVSSALTGPQG